MKNRHRFARIIMFFCILSLCLAMAAHSHASSALLGKLDGNWICDGEATLALSGDADVTLKEKQAVVDALNKIIFRFNTKASTMTCTVPNGSQTLNYKVSEQTADTITLKAGSNITITFRPDNSILLNDGKPGSKGAVLRRIE